MKKLIIHTDGGARGNPGPAGIGVIISDEEGNILKQEKRYLGEATNNQAEYEAVILALHEAKQMGAENIDFYLDSELVVNQINQDYKIKNHDLGKLFIKVWNLKQNFKEVKLTHIPREENKLADKLVNQAIDDGIEKTYVSKK